MKTGATVRAHGIMQKTVAHTMLLYSNKSWLVMGEMLNILEGFHHQAERGITGMTVKSVADRKCEYPLVVAALEAADLHPIHEYIQIRQNTSSANVAC